MYWSVDITSYRKTKKIRTKTQHNRDTFAITPYILACFVQVLALFCPLSSSLKETVPENMNLGKPPPANQAPESKTL